MTDTGPSWTSATGRSPSADSRRTDDQRRLEELTKLVEQLIETMEALVG